MKENGEVVILVQTFSLWLQDRSRSCLWNTILLHTHLCDDEGCHSFYVISTAAEEVNTRLAIQCTLFLPFILP